MMKKENIEVSKNKILIIDQDSSVYMPLESILVYDWEVITVNSGDEGVSKALSDKPDLIFLNAMIPSMKGLETLSALKKSADLDKIPVIIVANAIDEAVEEESFNLGAADFICMPFRSAMIKARVKNQLQIVNQIKTIEQLGLTDPLTSLYNRRGFNDRYNSEWRRCIREKVPVSFIMLDVDKFMDYNDTYGHPQGDLLLKIMASLFEGTARRPTDVVTRLRGQEFGILLPNTPMEPALDIAENIRDSVERLRLLTEDGETETKITVSIGVASIVPSTELNPDTLVNEAEKFLSKAKASGRNRVCSEKN